MTNGYARRLPSVASTVTRVGRPAWLRSTIAIWTRRTGDEHVFPLLSGNAVGLGYSSDTAAVTALLDRLLHHARVLKCGPRSWRTKVQTTLRTQDAVK